VLLDAVTGVGSSTIVKTAAAKLAARTTTATTGTITISEANAVAVDAVSGVNGISTNNSAISLTAGGTLTLTQGVNAGTSSVSLATTGAGDILDNGGTVFGGAGATLTTAGGDIGQSAARVIFADGQTGVNATSNGGDIFLGSTGALTLNTVSSAGGAIDV